MGQRKAVTKKLATTYKRGIVVRQGPGSWNMWSDSPAGTGTTPGPPCVSAGTIKAVLPRAPRTSKSPPHRW